jgi:hypothetical protein
MRTGPYPVEPFRQWWLQAIEIVYGQAFHYFPPGVDRSGRIELTEYAIKKARLLAWGRYQQEGPPIGNDLTTWTTKKARQEVWRKLPLIRPPNGWLWQLTREERRLLLLQYECLDDFEIGFVLGLPVEEVRKQLDEAKDALKEQIRGDGKDPGDWYLF